MGLRTHFFVEFVCPLCVERLGLRILIEHIKYSTVEAPHVFILATCKFLGALLRSLSNRKNQVFGYLYDRFKAVICICFN